MRISKVRAVMGMRKGSEITQPRRGGKFNMPMRPLPASYAFSVSLFKSNYANPDTEKSLNELSSLATANCRLL